jgi:hypothetical protein
MSKLSIGSILGVSDDDLVEKYDNDNFLTQPKKTINDDINEIIETNKKRREDKLKMYREVLRNCIRLINNKNKQRGIDIIYKINYALFGFPEGDTCECIEYLVIELMKLRFDVYQIDQHTIYISWKFIEFHRQYM